MPRTLASIRSTAHIWTAYGSKQDGSGENDQDALHDSIVTEAHGEVILLRNFSAARLRSVRR